MSIGLSAARNFIETPKIYLFDISRSIARRCNIDTETVQTFVSPNPRTWRIAVTRGVTTAIMDTASAVAAAVGFSPMANFASSLLG